MNSAARTIKFNYALRLVMNFYVTILQLCAQAIDSIPHAGIGA